MAQAAGPDDTAVISFSGHGGRAEDGPEAGTYLIPYDCDPQRLKDTAIGSEESTGLLSDVKAGRRVVLLDACHPAGAGELKALARSTTSRPDSTRRRTTPAPRVPDG